MEFRATQIQAAVMFTWQLDTQIQPGLWKDRGWAGGAVLFFQKSVVFNQLSSISVCGDGLAQSRFVKQVKGRKGERREKAGDSLKRHNFTLPHPFEASVLTDVGEL